MIKFKSVGLFLVLFALSCQKEDAPGEQPIDQQPDEVSSAITTRSCASDEVFKAQLAADPAFRKRVEAIEAFTSRMIQSGALRNSKLSQGTLTIPVVVHVLYRTAQENISNAQIQSQINVLNEDFNLENADHTKVPSYFADAKAAVGIRFTLAKVIRKATNKRSWGTNDAMKKSKMGGSNPVDPAHYLNLWSCNLGQGLLGYAQFPGGNPATDGVVVLYSAVGSRAKAAGTYVSNYDLGRTATHEVGHWLNLRHIWGDATCGNDLVGDTPQHDASNGGCPAADLKSTCTGTPYEMWMNYMDYTYDACMYMFSNGQKERMLAVFAPYGPRNSFAQ